MRIRREILVALSSVAAMATVADTEYGYDPSDPKIYIATVHAGETNEISAAAVSVLNADGVTNFVKRGQGVLVSNKDITSYTGGIAIEDGIFRSVPNTQANDTVGKLSGGGEIWVLDGATMELYAPNMYSTHMNGKTTHIAGGGFGGRGALVACAGNLNQAGATFGSTIKLEADARVSNDGSNYFYLAVDGCTVDFNAKTLYAGGAGEIAFVNEPTLKNMPNPGTAIFSDGHGVKFGRPSSGSFNLWHTYCGIVLTNGSRLIISSLFGTNFAWPLTLHEGTGIHVTSTGAEWVANTQWNRLTANAVLSLLDGDRNWIQFNGAKDFLFIQGKITGGGLNVRTYTPGSSLYLSNKDNSFTNGLVASRCAVHVMTNGALPSAGAAFSLTNAYAVFHSSQAYLLPPLAADGNCAVSNYTGFSASGAWRDSVTKTGTGTLAYRTLIGAPLLDVRGGTVKIEAVGGELPAFEALGGSVNGTVDFGGNAYSVSKLAGAPQVVNCPALTVTAACEMETATLDGSSGFSTDGSLVFGAGAKLTVSDADLYPAGRRSRRWTIVSAEDGITGMPALDASLAGWTLAKSADGRTLALASPAVGFELIVR